MIPGEVIDEIRLENDIVGVVSERVALKQRGRNFVGLCPFHNEKTPSFSVSPDRQIFNCFGCNTGGNVFTFIMKIENFEFIEAVKYLADRVNIRLPEKDMSEDAKEKARLKAELYDIQKESAIYFHNSLVSETGAPAREYLTERGLVPKLWTRFGLGYSPGGRDSLYRHLLSKGFTKEAVLSSGLVVDKDGNYRDRFFNRLMFPILDVNKKVIAFGGRVIGKGEPKYLNSSDTAVFNKGRNLYGLNFAKSHKSIILVEGYMDVIALCQAGFANAVAALGTAFTDNHAALLKKFAEDIVICFDGDGAGVNAAMRAIPILSKTGVQLRALRLEGAKDPDEFINKFGAKAFAEQLANAESYVMFQIEQSRKKFDMTKQYQVNAFANEAAVYLSQMQNDIDRSGYISEVAKISKLNEEALENQVKRLSGPEIVDFESRKRVIKNKGNLDEARRGVLYFICADRDVFIKIKSVLNGKEMVDPVYVRLFSLIGARYAEKDKLYAADLISVFESPDEQVKAASVFATDIEYENTEIKEKALNDQIRLIKKAYIDFKKEEIKKSGELTDQNLKKLDELARESKNIDKCSYITLSDG